jgi:NDP-sugar pyrophosphorylase family protein
MCRRFEAITSDIFKKEEKARAIMLKEKIERIPVLSKDGKVMDVILWTDIFGEEDIVEERNILTNPVVIMAGGKGTRLDPFTKILPKPLIPIGNKPVIELIMEKFYQCGFNRFIYSLNYKKEYIKLFIKESNFPYIIDFVEEEDFLGTIGCLSLMKDKIDKTFFVTNCDSLMDVDYKSILDWHKEHDASLTIVGSHNEFRIPFGVLEMSDGRLEKILEKPVHDMIVNTGVYVIEPHVLSYVPDNKLFDMNELIEKILEKEKVTVYPVCEGWFDIGQWKEYQDNLERLKGL